MEEARAEEIAAGDQEAARRRRQGVQRGVEREKELLQEYEKLTDQPFDDE